MFQLLMYHLQGGKCKNANMFVLCRDHCTVKIIRFCLKFQYVLFSIYTCSVSNNKLPHAHTHSHIYIFYYRGTIYHTYITPQNHTIYHTYITPQIHTPDSHF